MTDLNTLTIHGRIVRNAEFSTTDNGLNIVRFTLALNKARRNQNNEWFEETTYVPMALFGKRALCLGPYIKKGRGITVQGHLKQNRWEKDGEKRIELAVVVDNILFDAVAKKTEEVQVTLQPPVVPVAPQLMNPSLQETHKQDVSYQNDPAFMNEGDFYRGESDFDFPPLEELEGFDIY